MGLEERYRVVVFVLVEHLEAILDSICSSRLLDYGNYKDVLWFSAVGTEQFEPLEGSNPTHGKIGGRERLPSVRVEFSIEKDGAKLSTLIDNFILPAHPWEEPVIYVSIVMENIIKKAKVKND